jgi:hypothetical protein
VNATFVLVTTAWLAGAEPAGTPAPPPSAAVNSSCCSGTCDACCESGHHRESLFSRLKGRFHRGGDCCDTGCSSSAPAPAAASCCNAAPAASCCDTGCEEKPGFLTRLKARFHRGNDCCDTGSTCGACSSCGSVGAYGAPIMNGKPPEQIGAPKDLKKMPVGGEGKPKEVRIDSPIQDAKPAASEKNTGKETKNPFEPDRRDGARLERAADYSQVTGQLYFVHADGGLWVLRYAPLGKEDQNGGSVVLARDRRMDSYREGDLVRVRGEIINPKGSIFLGGPLYRVQSIQLVDRSSP